MDDKELDQMVDDLTHYLPAPLRNDWVVIPKVVIHKTALAMALFGAAVALSIVGFALNIREMTWPLPVLLATMAFATKFVPWWREDRFIDQLSETKEEANP